MREPPSILGDGETFHLPYHNMPNVVPRKRQDLPPFRPTCGEMFHSAQVPALITTGGNRSRNPY